MRCCLPFAMAAAVTAAQCHCTVPAAALSSVVLHQRNNTYADFVWHYCQCVHFCEFSQGCAKYRCFRCKQRAKRQYRSCYMGVCEQCASSDAASCTLQSILQCFRSTLAQCHIHLFVRQTSRHASMFCTCLALAKANCVHQ
jgi:hypothetical protein